MRTDSTWILRRDTTENREETVQPSMMSEIQEKGDSAQGGFILLIVRSIVNTTSRSPKPQTIIT